MESPEVGVLITSVLQRRKRRLRRVGQFTHDGTGSRWQGWTLTSLSCPELKLFSGL